MIGDCYSRSEKLSDYITLDYDILYENDRMGLLQVYNELHSEYFLNTFLRKKYVDQYTIKGK